jgi:hypothetical protein
LSAFSKLDIVSPSDFNNGQLYRRERLGAQGTGVGAKW